MLAVQATSQKETIRASWKATESTGRDKLLTQKGRATRMTGNNLESLILKEAYICAVMQTTLPKARGVNLWNINSSQPTQLIERPARVPRRDELPVKVTP